MGAALLKWDTGNVRGRRLLWRRARAHLAAVPGGDGPVLGLDVAHLLTRLDEGFAAVDAADDAEPSPVPVIHLWLTAG